MIPDKGRYNFIHTVLFSTAHSSNPGLLLLALQSLCLRLQLDQRLASLHLSPQSQMGGDHTPVHRRLNGRDGMCHFQPCRIRDGIHGQTRQAAPRLQAPCQACPNLAPRYLVLHQRLVVVEQDASRLHLCLHFHVCPPCTMLTPAASPMRRCAGHSDPCHNARLGCAITPPGHCHDASPRWGDGEMIPAGSGANLIFS